MLFRKRNRRGGAPVQMWQGGEAIAGPADRAFFHIPFEMMSKGHIAKRRGRPIRQYCVSVGGTIRLVTSGDTVDRATYDALVAAGVIQPCADDEAGNNRAPSSGDSADTPDPSPEE